VKAPQRGIWGCVIKDVPADIEAWRREFRARPGRAAFRGWGHFAAAAVMTRDVLWWEWLTLPVGFLIANFVEWIAHRFPMHHPTRGLMIMYEKHTLDHHRFYSEAAMEAETSDDFDSVLFSLPALVFFLVGLGGPIAAAFFLLVSANAGWLFVALACANYALYECFHMAYHLPEDSWVGRLPGMSRLRLHHTNHHDPRLMADWNFNVTFPIFDALGGTHWERARRQIP
jgi:hypothetical protein